MKTKEKNNNNTDDDGQFIVLLRAQIILLHNLPDGRYFHYVWTLTEKALTSFSGLKDTQPTIYRWRQNGIRSEL